MLKIGAVPFINALPLCRYLDQPITLATPVELDQKMKAGELDVALLPAFSFLSDPSYFPIWEAGGILSDGPVESVLFIHQKTFKSGAVKNIKYSYKSKTSNNLFKVIYSLRWGGVLADIAESQSDPDGFIEIGDDALFRKIEQGWIVRDLGEEWTSWTNLPFVYALWVSRKELTEAQKEPFIEAKKQGLNRLEEIVKESRDLPPDRLRRYLTKSIRYEITPKARQGLVLFQEYCCQLGLIE